MIKLINILNEIYKDKKPKYYHTSGTRFKVGDIIGGPGKQICLNTSPIPHCTIQDIVKGGFSCYKDYQKACEKDYDIYYKKRDEWNKTGIGEEPEYPETKNKKPVNLYVYEVKPFKKPVWTSNEEYCTFGSFAEIIRIVGNAKGILDNHLKKFGDSKKRYYFGGRALKRGVYKSMIKKDRKNKKLY